MSTKQDQKTVTKAQIVSSVYEALNQTRGDDMGRGDSPMMTRKASAELVDHVFNTIKDQIQVLRDELAQERTVKSKASSKKPERRLKISGFGNFIVRHKSERTGRNPQTGKRIQISSRYVLTFKPSQVLKKEINSAQ